MVNQYTFKGICILVMILTSFNFSATFDASFSLPKLENEPSTIQEWLAKSSYIVGDEKFDATCPTGTAPTVVANALPPSCNGDNSINTDGFLQIATISDGDRFNWSIGSSYTGDTNYANATNTSGLSFPIVVATGLPNPAVSQDYTIRVFNGASNCFTDVIVTMDEQVCATGCNCIETIYLDEPGISSVLKFEVTPALLLPELEGINSGAAPQQHWYPGTTTSVLPNPHGLAVGPNGNLFIGADFQVNNDIREFNCDGSILPVDANTINYPYIMTNMFAIQNTLYGTRSAGPAAFDLCSGIEIGTACFNDGAGVAIPHVNTTGSVFWGLSYNETIDMVYATGTDGPRRGIWAFTSSELDNSISTGSCLDPLLWVSPTVNYAAIATGDNFLPSDINHLNGIIADNSGNMYVTGWVNVGTAQGYVLKYDSSGGLLAKSVLDPSFRSSRGIVWSETTNRIYIANQIDDVNVDCISAFADSDLNYLGTAVPNPGIGGNQSGKAMALTKECCPSNNNVVIDTTFCDALGMRFSLRDLIGCDGNLCEGQWTTPQSTPGMTYDGCENSVTLNAYNTCNTFIFSYDGANSFSTCSAFQYTVNICSESPPTAIAHAIQPSCNGDNTINSDGFLQLASSEGDRFNWSIGSTYTGDADYANAIDTAGLSFPIEVTNGLPNPSGSQDYTIRVFNLNSTCFSDVVVTINEQDCFSGCICTERIYLNEPGIDGVLKFTVNSAVSLTEVGGVNGGPPNDHWHPGTEASVLPSPHGLAVGPNGNLFIGATADQNSFVREFNCDGSVLPINANTISFPYRITNAFGIGNTLYGTRGGGTAAFDICAGTELGSVCYNDNTGAQIPFTDNLINFWGLSYNEVTETAYVTGSTGGNMGVWAFSRAALESGIAGGACISPLIWTSIAVDYTSLTAGINTLPNDIDLLRGVVGDNSNNIYITGRYNGNNTGFILKYDSNGDFVSSTIDNAAFAWATGIVYSSQTNRIYVSNNTDNNGIDCISAFDTNLNYLGTAAPNPNIPANNGGKAMALIKECCPTNNNVTIDTVLCNVDLGVTLSLRDLLVCEGNLCEGTWSVPGPTPGMTYDNCNNAVILDAYNTCGTFIYSYDGLNPNSPCSAFQYTVNVCSGCYDYGDLPDTGAGTSTANYQTDDANMGPSHNLVPGLTIGSLIDDELDGQANTGATGDTVDEDGFSFPSTLDITPSGTVRLPINIRNATGTVAHYEVWIDWNGDGDFNDPNEMVIDLSDDGLGNFGQASTAINVPTNAVLNQPLGFRARLSHTDNMTPLGQVLSGEVEDYLIMIQCNNPICLPVSVSITKN